MSWDSPFAFSLQPLTCRGLTARRYRKTFLSRDNARNSQSDMLAGMEDDGSRDVGESIQWLMTFCLVIVAVVLCGVLAGVLLRGSGLR